jgi:DNA-directed RNA polymerase subunit K/omega
VGTAMREIKMDGNYHETIKLVGTAMREIKWMEITTRQ